MGTLVDSASSTSGTQTPRLVTDVPSCRLMLEDDLGRRSVDLLKELDPVVGSTVTVGTIPVDNTQDTMVVGLPVWYF